MKRGDENSTPAPPPTKFHHLRANGNQSCRNDMNHSTEKGSKWDFNHIFFDIYHRIFFAMKWRSISIPFPCFFSCSAIFFAPKEPFPSGDFQLLTRWWFQVSTHLKNMLVKLNHHPQVRLKNKKIFELPPPPS